REDLNSGGYVLITFMLEELSSTSPINPQFIFNFRKETQDKIIFFDKNNFGNNDTEITNLSFDDKTGRLRGNFEVTSDNNSSGESAIITGEFDVVVKRAVE
ncbi:MAG TPA: hypothetical protein VD908_00005, partial [Cytophagales bacterium]|nr:hypothetical protein [Cytophagales bacterium]